MKLLAVYTTVCNREVARHMARVIVERKLAACAQVCDIESFYTWKGNVQNEPECRILFKTTAAQYSAIESAIRSLHTYELPAIHAVMLDQAFGPYAEWIEKESPGE